MADYHRSLEKTRTNLQALIVVLLQIGISALCYWGASWTDTHSYPTFSRALYFIAGTLLATGVLSVVWELYLRRSFTAEVLSAANISVDLRDAGLTKIEFDGTCLPWSDLFEGANELDLLFSHASSWRGTYEARLKRIAEKCPGKVRVFLPDPDNDAVVSELSARFGKTTQAMKDKILAAKSDFQQMGIRVFLLSIAPTYSAYRFGDSLIVAFYSHTKEKAYVPHFVCSRGGKLFEFVSTQLNELSIPERGISKEIPFVVSGGRG